MLMTKILYSPGLGTGWSTWVHDDKPEFVKFMLTYPPLIEAVEKGEKLAPDHPALQAFLEEAKEKFGEDNVCCSGAYQPAVAEVSGPFRVDEYDGSESIVEASSHDWINI
jgi:hypothetical protein